MEHCLSYIIANNVSQSLLEDTRYYPDYTALLIDDYLTTAKIVTKQDMILCGIEWVNYTLFLCDNNYKIKWFFKDGDKVAKNTKLCDITAKSRSILTAERTALNFLQTLSATATVTNQFVEKIKNTTAKICDTRKTIPNLRYAQKYAVVVGGGVNQRLGLYDGILIKDNHIAAIGSIKQVLLKATTLFNHLPIQIEVETITQLKEALKYGAQNILLDNMQIDDIIKSVNINKKKAILEASGDITINNVLEYALTGIDRISIGSLTKHINAIDLSLEFKIK